MHTAFADACARLFMRRKEFRSRYRIHELNPNEAEKRFNCKIHYPGYGTAKVKAHLEIDEFIPDCGAIAIGKTIRRKNWILDNIIFE